MPENHPPEKPTQKLTLSERIEQEAARRANQQAEDFDLLACVPFKDVEFDGEEGIHLHGPRGREMVITLEQVNVDIRRFLEEHLPAKIAERLRTQILSTESPEINVTEL